MCSFLSGSGVCQVLVCHRWSRFLYQSRSGPENESVGQVAASALPLLWKDFYALIFLHSGAKYMHLYTYTCSHQVSVQPLWGWRFLLILETSSLFSAWLILRKLSLDTVVLCFQFGEFHQHSREDPTSRWLHHRLHHRGAVGGRFDAHAPFPLSPGEPAEAAHWFCAGAGEREVTGDGVLQKLWNKTWQTSKCSSVNRFKKWPTNPVWTTGEREMIPTHSDSSQYSLICWCI